MDTQSQAEKKTSIVGKARGFAISGHLHADQ